MFKYALRKHARGEEVDFKDPSGEYGEDFWQIYSSMAGWRKVNRALTSACKRVFKAFDKATIRQVQAVDSWYGMDLDI
jgi:hypothetical protein